MKTCASTSSEPLPTNTWSGCTPTAAANRAAQVVRPDPGTAGIAGRRGVACNTLGDGPYGFSLVFSLTRSGSLVLAWDIGTERPDHGTPVAAHGSVFPGRRDCATT